MSVSLTPRKIHQYKLRLQEHLESLALALNKGTDAGIEKRGAGYRGEVHDRGEESSADAQSEINSAINASHVNELGCVRHALQRIQHGTYGTCEDCGGPIGEERLDANPCARRCIDCQSDYERMVS